MPPVIESIEDLIKAVREQCESHNSGDWIESWGYDEGKLTEGRSPSRYDLDRATTDVPVVITRTCGHIIVVNSKALELAGITKNTPNPAGGRLTGIQKGSRQGYYGKMQKNWSIK